MGVPVRTAKNPPQILVEDFSFLLPSEEPLLLKKPSKYII